MKLLITGDIHGRNDILEKILLKETNFTHHLNTGDVGLDIKTIEKTKMMAVKGNTDYFLDLPLESLIEIEDKKILLTHGHLYNVKYGLNELISYAKKLNVNMCIFGHTHEAFYQKLEGIEFINPGALSGMKHKSYALYESGKVKFIHAD